MIRGDKQKKIGQITCNSYAHNYISLDFYIGGESHGLYFLRDEDGFDTCKNFTDQNV